MVALTLSFYCQMYLEDENEKHETRIEESFISLVAQCEHLSPCTEEHHQIKFH